MGPSLHLACLAPGGNTCGPRSVPPTAWGCCSVLRVKSQLWLPTHLGPLIRLHVIVYLRFEVFSDPVAGHLSTPPQDFSGHLTVATPILVPHPKPLDQNKDERPPCSPCIRIFFVQLGAQQY